MPVTISGCWCSSPTFFQYSVLVKIFSYASRSFSSLIAGGADSDALDASEVVGGVAG